MDKIETELKKANNMTDKNKIKYNLRGIVTGKPSPAIKKIVDSLTPEDMDEAKKELEQESVSEELEEEITKCYKSRSDLMMTRKQFGELIHRFTEWQKEQMMAKAIDAELYSDGMLTPIIGVKDKEKISGIKFGDKVKIIIIKDE